MLKKLTALYVLAAFALPVSTVIAQTSAAAPAAQSAEASASATSSTAAATPAVPAPAPTPPTPPKRCDFAITLQSDEIFEHKKSAQLPILNSKGKERIDSEVLSKLANCTKVELIVVSGHTDLIGSHAQTQKLSEKNADAVVAYLGSKGLNAPMDTMGMGKTQQIKACDDKLAKAKLAECLAPNRRIVIEGRGLAK
ncbi:OmpA family protein [Undibacterium sp. CY18W]|uniref:OmpA family protein n=1 Tax=Undibacterium hunanense TaxID=2762292 RepID=A0ABR6ZQG9_9BURK|nr:OmpA family protein [Undibacterium hunanense]MBC3918131.1 OmpA family protein [Undibacterium hunanense]